MQQINNDILIGEDETVYGKHTFLKPEIDNLAVDMARMLNEKKRLEDERKSQASHFKAEIDAVQERVNKLSENYSKGYEHRNIYCLVELDRLSQRKRYIEKDTGALIKEAPLTEKDL